MTDAPERIWMDPDIRFPECEKQYGCGIEYIRADLVDASAVLEAKLAKAVQALEKINVKKGWAAHIARTTLAELEQKQ